MQLTSDTFSCQSNKMLSALVSVLGLVPFLLVSLGVHKASSAGLQSVSGISGAEITYGSSQ